MIKLNKYIILGIGAFVALITFTSLTVDKKKKNNPQFETIETNVNGKGNSLVFELEIGESHNHPTMAIWIEDMNENYIQTIYVTKSVATGVYGHGEKKESQWSHESGPVRRPATIPYYLHKRNIKANDGTYLPTPENPVPDAYTGATPKASFKLNSKANELLAGKYKILFEVNQPWDWNEHWHNSLYPDDFNYKTSCQPALIYATTVDFSKGGKYFLNPIGHAHYSGANGELYTNLSTITSARHIFKSISVTVK